MPTEKKVRCLETQLASLAVLAEACVSHDPSDRPTFSALATELNLELNALTLAGQHGGSSPRAGAGRKGMSTWAARGRRWVGAALADRLRMSPRRCSSFVGDREEVLDLWRLLEPAWGPARARRCTPARSGPPPA